MLYNLKDSLVNDHENGIIRDYLDGSLVIDDLPEFFNGDYNSFKVFIQKNFTYPIIAAENGIQGHVFVQFAINEVGRVVDAKIVDGVHQDLDRAAWFSKLSSCEGPVYFPN